MAKKMVNKTISFNVLDPFQLQMKEYAERYPNFSGYIKRLIQRDMEQVRSAKFIKKAPSTPVTIQVQARNN